MQSYLSSSAFEKFSKSTETFFAVRYVRNALTAYFVAFLVLSESPAKVEPRPN